MNRRNLLLAIGAGMLVLAGATLLLLAQNLDALVRRAIESYGSETTGTAVQVADVRIAVSDGHGTLRGLTVANPPGFSPTPLFVLDDIAVKFDAASLTSAVPVVEELLVGATTFHYEVALDGRSNLSVLQKHIKSTAQSTQSREPGTAKRLRIRRLVIADGEATFDLGRIGIGRASARVPGMTLTDLGGERGLTPQELANTVLAALVKKLEKVAAEAGLRQLLRDKKGSQTGEMLKGLIGR